MTFEALLAYLGASLAIVGGGVLCQRSHTLVPRAFALGMLVLALREACVGLGAQTLLPVDALYWRRLGWMITTVLPGSWLLFSISFARSNYRELLAKWKWGIVGALALPVALVTVCRRAFLDIPAEVSEASPQVLRFDWLGYTLCIFGLLLAVVVLVNLEGTLRASAGAKRWQVKFMLLGVGSLFAAYIYTMSQTLLFSAVTVTLQSVDSCAVVVANILIIVSLTRDRLLQTQVYFSQAALYNSLAVLLIGSYLLTVGLLAKAIQYLGGNKILPLGTFVVFMALVGLTLILLSERLRQTIKQFIRRHLYHARYDYRHMWMAFSQRTTSVVDVQELCTVVAKMVSETFGVPAVTIWLRQEEANGEIRLGGSTVFSEGQLPLPGFAPQGWVELLGYMCERQFPVDFEAPPDKLGEVLYQAQRDGFRHASIRYCVSLTAAQESLGVMTLHNRLTREAFTSQDYELLQTIADQVAASLLNLQLGQRLARAKQMEAFQTLSAFFVHDLKNLASKLSMTVTNLPAHYENPAFREDMLRTLSGSVTRINAMCGRLAQLTHQLELHCTRTDLNALIRAVLADLRPSLTGRLVEDLQPVPWPNVDSEQLQKVVVNLVLNAHEAIGANGAIRVATERVNGWVVLAVSDNGCGMSREFLERSLFQPFRTTKKSGLGIGLFQSRIIVEAHQGKIEVESEADKGSTFRVFLRCEA